MMININNRNPRLSATRWMPALGMALCVLITGCGNGIGGYSSSDRVGRTYYIDGAGNWGFGVAEVIGGLKAAGYKGNVINYRWSPTFNPALDQTIGRPIARLKGADLGNEIARYLDKFPDNQVNIISLSAGTGIGIWACENVTSKTKVNNVIMLGSSLSSTYDAQKALSNISGGIWVYYSSYDQILQGPVRTLGTIDGELGVESAGLVGLQPRTGPSDKIHNIRWSPKYERYGWTGAHTDATSEPFVRMVLSAHIIGSQSSAVGRSSVGKESPLMLTQH